MFLRKRRAQSTLEYVVILVGIVIAIIAAKSILSPKIQKSIGDDAASAIEKSTQKLTTSLDGYGGTSSQGGGDVNK